MSVQRVFTSLTSSSSLLVQLASSPKVCTRQSCQHIFRSFSSAQLQCMSSKRKMQTISAYHPSLDSNPPPPPRNVGVPNASITRAIPQVNDTRPPNIASDLIRELGQPRDQQPSISLREQDVQRTRPVHLPSLSTADVAPAQPRTKPRPKLRARKAAMNLTPGAVKQLRAMLDQPSPKLIKVGVRNRGCSGLAYHLEYVEKPGMLDEMVEQDGVRVLIDSKALFSIIGSEMDWVEDKLNQRFVFKNPNIKEQCGCGESFMV